MALDDNGKADGSTSDVLGAADAFMSRLTPPAEEDVPLLTEVVEAPAELGGVVPATPHLSPTAQAALSQELEEWLDMHLTEAVLKVLDGVADQLVARITQEARQDLLPRLHAALLKAAPDDAA